MKQALRVFRSLTDLLYLVLFFFSSSASWTNAPSPQVNWSSLFLLRVWGGGGGAHANKTKWRSQDKTVRSSDSVHSSIWIGGLDVLFMLTDQFMTSLFSPLCVCMEMTWVELGVRMGDGCDCSSIYSFVDWCLFCCFYCHSYGSRKCCFTLSAMQLHEGHVILDLIWLIWFD